jgi:hypothetical protein
VQHLVSKLWPTPHFPPLQRQIAGHRLRLLNRADFQLEVRRPRPRRRMSAQPSQYRAVEVEAHAQASQSRPSEAHLN